MNFSDVAVVGVVATVTSDVRRYLRRDWLSITDPCFDRWIGNSWVMLCWFSPVQFVVSYRVTNDAVCVLVYVVDSEWTWLPVNCVSSVARDVVDFLLVRYVYSHYYAGRV